MEPEEKLKWSRHYDSIQWTVTAILVVAVGGLLVYCSDDHNYDPWLAVFGIILTLASSFFATSFRALRRKLQDGLPKQTLYYLRSHWMFRQWPVHCMIHIFLLFLWSLLIYENSPQLHLLWIFVGIGFALIPVLGFLANVKPMDEKPNPSSNGTNETDSSNSGVN